MSFDSVIVTLIYALDIVCIVIVIFSERKNPQSTIAWTLVFILLPLVGFIAYLMFGSGFHVNKKKRYAAKRMRDAMNRQFMAKHIERDASCRIPDNPRLGRLIGYFERDGGSLYVNDNEARIFCDGRELFDAMIDDMRRAEKHIHLLYYIFRNDALGRRITAALTEKAKSGVEVRVIYDSLGSMLNIGRMFRDLIAAGGEVRAFSPILFSLTSHLRLNYRNHRKITVVDGKIAYVGGMNIGVEYLGEDKRLRPWRDTQLRLWGSSASFLQERFLLDWMSLEEEERFNDADLERFFPTPERRGGLGAQIVSSGPDMATAPIKNGLLEMLYAARKRIFIQTPYFTPDDGFRDALEIAALSGVDVRLMLPGVADQLFVGAATLSFARQLLDSGVKIHLYNGFLHAKTMSVDGMAATIGTANIGNRSFTMNFEVNAFVYDAGFAKSCEEIFLKDQENCSPLTHDWFLKQNPLMRATISVSRLFAPLI